MACFVVSGRQWIRCGLHALNNNLTVHVSCSFVLSVPLNFSSTCAAPGGLQVYRQDTWSGKPVKQMAKAGCVPFTPDVKIFDPAVKRILRLQVFPKCFKVEFSKIHHCRVDLCKGRRQVKKQIPSPNLTCVQESPTQFITNPQTPAPILAHLPSKPYLLRLRLNKAEGVCLTYGVNATCFSGRIKADPIALFRHKHHLGPKRRADKLSAAGILPAFIGDGLQHLRDGGAVLGVKVGVDFVEEVEGCWIALLDCEDEG